MAAYSLTILIPTFNGRKHLGRCLPSVVRHAPAGTQILVVDDGSTDGTAEWIARAFPQVEVLALAHNGGFCHAVNAGLGMARGEIVELLNNDTEVCPGWVEPCLRHFDDPTVGSVAPLVLVMDQPDTVESAGQEYHICGWAYNRRYNQKLRPEDLKAREVFCPSGSSGFYRRALLLQVGGLLPEYDAYFEDTDLGFRLRWAGYRCLYEPASRMYHRLSATYKLHNELYVRLIARNEELVYWINLPLVSLLVGLLPHIGFQAIRVEKARSRDIGPFLRGKWQAARQLSQILKRRKELRQQVRVGGLRPTHMFCQGSGVLAHGWRWLRRRQCG